MVVGQEPEQQIVLNRITEWPKKSPHWHLCGNQCFGIGLCGAHGSARHWNRLTGDQDIKRATEPEHPHRGPMKRINEDHRISRPSKYIADPSALGSIWIIGLHLDHRAQFGSSGSIWIQIPVNKWWASTTSPMIRIRIPWGQFPNPWDQGNVAHDKDYNTMLPISSPMRPG